MKVILLRHEKRSADDATFHSPLTAQGMHDAIEVVTPQLLEAGITHVYTSPLLRCLQTLHPLCSRSPPLAGRVREEYALYERVRAATGYERDTYRQRVGPAFAPLVDPTYEPCVQLDNVGFDESDADVAARARLFREHLHSAHHEHDTVLVVTHLSVVNALLGRDDSDDRVAMGELVHTTCGGDDGAGAPLRVCEPEETTSVPPSSRNGLSTFERWLRRPSVCYALPIAVYLKLLAGTKSLTTLFGQFAVNFVSVVGKLTNRLMTEATYARICRWYVCISSELARVRYSPHLRAIAEHVSTDCSKYMAQCADLASQSVRACDAQFKGVYATEQQRYMDESGD